MLKKTDDLVQEGVPYDELQFKERGREMRKLVMTTMSSRPHVRHKQLTHMIYHCSNIMQTFHALPQMTFTFNSAAAL